MPVAVSPGGVAVGGRQTEAQELHRRLLARHLYQYQMEAAFREQQFHEMLEAWAERLELSAIKYRMDLAEKNRITWERSVDAVLLAEL